jgi:hypothetical protein
MVSNKRGLSDIVTNVLIVLLVLVAVGIIWFFIQPFIRQGVSGISADAYTVILTVQPRSAFDDGNNVSFVVKREAGKGNLVGFSVIITDGGGNSKVVRQSAVLNELETLAVSVNYRTLGLTSVKTVAVVPIIGDQSGGEQNGQQSAPETPSTSGGGGSCTNGATQACTSGGYPGTQTCTAGIWGSCVVTLSCGDGTKTTPPEACDYHGSTFVGTACNYMSGAGDGNYTCTTSCQYSTTCSCYLDFDGDGFLGGGDFDSWSDAYSNSGDPQHPRTDCNHDGVISSADVVCFNYLFDNGKCNF